MDNCDFHSLLYVRQRVEMMISATILRMVATSSISLDEIKRLQILECLPPFSTAGFPPSRYK